MVASVHTSDFRALKWSVNRVFNGSVESLLAWKVEMSWAKLPLCFPPSPHRHRHHRGCLPSCWSGRRSCPCPCTLPGASPPASQGRSACKKSGDDYLRKVQLWQLAFRASLQFSSSPHRGFPEGLLHCIALEIISPGLRTWSQTCRWWFSCCTLPTSSQMVHTPARS